MAFDDKKLSSFLVGMWKEQKHATVGSRNFGGTNKHEGYSSVRLKAMTSSSDKTFVDALDVDTFIL